MLTTLAKAKQLLGIPVDDDSQDEELTMLLTAASAAIEERCRRSFGKQKYTGEVYNGVRSKYLCLRNYPIVSVDSVQSAGQPLVDVELVPDKGMLYRSAGWPCGERSITVTYTAGYVLPKDGTVEAPQTLPETLEVACIFFAKIMLEGQYGVESERIGDYSVKYMGTGGSSNTTHSTNTETPLPPAVESLVRMHVRPLS